MNNTLVTITYVLASIFFFLFSLNLLGLDVAVFK